MYTYIKIIAVSIDYVLLLASYVLKPLSSQKLQAWARLHHSSQFKSQVTVHSREVYSVWSHGEKEHIKGSSDP